MANAEIRLIRRVYAEAMMKRLVVVLLHLQKYIKFTFLFDTLAKKVFYLKTMLSVNLSALFS